MAYWAVVVPMQWYEAERLYHHDSVALDVTGPQAGDELLLVAPVEPPVIFGLARVTGPGVATYTQRNIDAPQPAGGLAIDGPLDEAAFRAAAARLGPPPERRDWLVSVDLPIEAGTAAEAVRQFWSYVLALGPEELPAFVRPVEDELAVQAYVLGAPTSLDPEAD